MNGNEEGISFLNQEDSIKTNDEIKPIEEVKINKPTEEKGDINASLPNWDINPPFELIDRSEQ